MSKSKLALEKAKKILMVKARARGNDALSWNDNWFLEHKELRQVLLAK